MSKIKVCGIRREEDIAYVNRFLPEYIGFVFAESKRRVSAEYVKMLVSVLNKRIKTSGVFVNEDIAKVVEIAGKCRLDSIQIHGDETPAYISALKIALKSYGLKDGKDCNEYGGKPVEIWKAIRVKDEDSIKAMNEYNVDAFVVDTYVTESYGGSGKTFDWGLAKEAKKYGKIILAGGLNCQNILEAIHAVRPYAVDVSSGIETNGWKDEEKVSNFINLVRSYE